MEELNIISDKETIMQLELLCGFLLLALLIQIFIIYRQNTLIENINMQNDNEKARNKLLKRRIEELNESNKRLKSKGKITI